MNCDMCHNEILIAVKTKELELYTTLSTIYDNNVTWRINHTMNFVWSYAYEVQNQEDNIFLGALKEKIRLIKIN